MTEPRHSERPSRLRYLPHWADLPALYLVFVGIPLVLGIVGGLLLPWYQARTAQDDEPVTEAALQPAPINGDRAYSYLQQICAIGPRPAGSEANARQRKLVADHFAKLGGAVREQPFSAVDPISGQPVAMANLIGSWFPERTDRVLICAHYDTRPHPDQETTQERYDQPFIGANDGASGVALLMEIAHHLNDLPTKRGVDLVLLDGEELVYGRTGEYFLGSKAFAKAYAQGRRSGKVKYRYSAGILLDMVGGRNLLIKREPYSVKLAPRLVEEVWQVARRIGARSFRRELGREVMDDHLALNDGGIPTIDLIDFDYPHWHLASDRPEQCSGASLAEVGRVVTAWLTLPRRK
jgi:hypothetical protein